MNEKDIEMLEFPKVREILAGFTSFSASRALAMQLQPSTDYDLISMRLHQSTEARRLLSLQPEFSVREAKDIREMTHTAARGEVLEPRALVEVQTTLAAARYVRTVLHKLANELPLLWSIADQIVELPHLEAEIGKSISEKGEVLDSASTWLSNLRSQLKDSQRQLVDRLQSIIKSPKGQKCVQEEFVTERDGRYVIPLKVEQRTEIKGIVHDISNTGATAFVEPWATVELGNELREITIEEKQEVERILSALSNEVGANEAVISDNVNLIAELDLAVAKARYARRAKATEPKIGAATASTEHDSRASMLRLVNARHPLLKDTAVPLSVEIGGDYSVLVVTGPNTGGKTVALKTIGLLTLMTQAGMPIPASEDTCIPIFDSILADIGDEQSIEQALSTYGWHMSNIVRILKSLGQRSLVLLDELGTSTDPREGAAIAQAILLHCLSSATMTVSTTHFSELKIFAHATPGMRNASLDFDPVTLAPTYHLTMGIPGGSNALAIASQLGLPSEIIDSARGMVSKSTKDVEALLAALQNEKKRIESLRNNLEQENRTAEDLRSHWENELQRLKEQERSILRDMIDKLSEETAGLQREVRHATSELKKARSQKNIEQAENALSAIRDHTESLNSQLQVSPICGAVEAAESGKISVGDEVWIVGINMWGTVLSLREGDDEIEVQVGHTKLTMNLQGIDKPKRPVSKPSTQPSRVVQKVSKATSPELNLRGKRADDAALELDRYLNDASLAHLNQVRVIHGFGTGTVRRIVRDTLSSHSLVKSFRPGEREEGGDGVTIVEL